jgi:hypothetical protein
MTVSLEHDMIFTDQLPSDVQQQISAKVTLLSRVVWPALATLVPAAATAAFKWAQDHSHKRRSAELTERISTLAKSIAELPEVSLTGATSAVTPQSVLIVELESAVRDLIALQTKANRRFTGVSTTAAKVRSALLLFRPKGLTAWTLHVTFFVYLFVLVFALLSIMTDQSAPFISTATTSDFVTDLFAFIFLFGVFGIPPLVIRHYAVKIHRKQCAEAQASAPAAVVSPVATPMGTSGQPV